MELADAQNRLKSLTAASVAPTLTDAEIDALLVEYRVIDPNGLLPNDPDWENTYNFNKAAREGWLIKAGKVSDLYDFSSDVNDFSRDQLYKHCVDMADKFLRPNAGSLPLEGRVTWQPVIGNYNDIGE